MTKTSRRGDGGAVHIVFPHFHRARSPDHGGKDPIPNFVFLSTAAVDFSPLDAIELNPGKYVYAHTSTGNKCTSNRSRLSRCYRSNSQVFKRIVQVVNRVPQPGKAGSWIFFLRPFRPERPRGVVTIATVVNVSLYAVEKISLFTSVGYNVSCYSTLAYRRTELPPPPFLSPPATPGFGFL